MIRSLSQIAHYLGLFYGMSGIIYLKLNFIKKITT